MVRKLDEAGRLLLLAICVSAKYDTAVAQLESGDSIVSFTDDTTVPASVI